MSPILPYITDEIEDVINMVKLSKDNGARFIYTWYGMTLRTNQRDYYYDRLMNLHHT